MLEKKYNHKLVEEGKYENWKNKGYFNSGDLNKEPFCIVIPPPNVTGNLHIGHAYDCSLQDIIIRYKKLQGFDTLWLPGMDHAAIATEAKVVSKLKEQGINKYDYGREKFLEACWSWSNEHRQNIRNQWAKMGFALDYRKERFTLDEQLNKAVRKVFVDYYNEGLIYRGERIINWDPVAKTALSNEEVIYKDDPGAFYHIKYYLEDSDEYLDIATTRPETLFGDTAVAVNPKDKRYLHLVGKNVILPIVNRLIPIITDEHADPEFGTGCVKITPAHDPNDFEVGERHNLERILIMNEDATMNELTGKYNKMTREECREELIKNLKEQDLLISIEPMIHSVGHSERTDAVVEPYLSKQWFVKMDKLSKMLIDNQKTDNKVNFIPKRYEKMLIKGWMEDCHDWCISRQLWWGHRIPIWYKEDEIYCGMTPPEEPGWHQDEDVLDTWFSSALWPFSTLGWPDNTEDYNRYFPTSVIVPGFDIIFFWSARMMFQSLKETGKRPYKDCIIHGLIRDSQGRKMSKSLGNGIDPLELIEEYGADALRFYLTTSSTLGTDLNFNKEKITSTWNFINKLWNASRFVLMKLENFKESDYQLTELSIPDQWILRKLNDTIKSVTKSMEKYDFNVAGSTLYSFIWDDFCDKYIEMSKFSEDNKTKSTLLYTLTSILKMMHPFMPFVTDEIYNNLPIKESDSIMLSTYPKYNKKYNFNIEEVNQAIEYITLFRNKKKELNIKEFEIINNITNKEISTLIINMLKLNDKINTNKKYELKESVKLSNLEIIILYNDEIDHTEELANLMKEKEKLIQSIERRKKLLANENYINKAPSNVVENDKILLSKEESKLKDIELKLK